VATSPIAAPGSVLSQLGKDHIEKTTGKKWDKHHPFFARCLKTVREASGEL
jgi:hypothetical protein